MVATSSPPVHTGAAVTIGIVTRRAGKAPCTGREQAKADARFDAYNSGDRQLIAARVLSDLTSIRRLAARPVHCSGSWRAVRNLANPEVQLIECGHCGALVAMLYGKLAGHTRPATAIERAAVMQRETEHLSSLYPTFAAATGGQA